MLPPAARLRRRAEFAATTRGGRRAARGSLVVHLTPGTAGAAHPPRAGFAVSRAVGNAVLRNRVRRRLRHLVAARLDRLPPGSCLVVRALPAAGRRSYQELAGDLDAAMAAALAPRRSRPAADRSAGGRPVRSGARP